MAKKNSEELEELYTCSLYGNGILGRLGIYIYGYLGI